MDRPFASKRPVGPFAQSDRFSNQLLGGVGNDEPVEEGNTLMVEILGQDSRAAMDMTNDIVPTMDEFVTLEEIGDAAGEREQTTPGRDVNVAILYYYVDRVQDREVTIGQIEQFIEQELQGSPANVFEANVHSI